MKIVLKMQSNFAKLLFCEVNKRKINEQLYSLILILVKNHIK